MKARSRLPYLFFWFSLALIIFGSMSCFAPLQWRIQIQIDVLTDGSASWIIQHTTVLTTEDDEAAFFEYLNITSMDVISSHIDSMVDHASLITGRNMRVQNLQVTADVSDGGLNKQGIIIYQFDWLGFAEITSDKEIKIGDSLSGELDLSRDDLLTIKYPSGFSSIFVYPEPDQKQESDGALEWFGPRNFGAGEPHALLGKKGFSWTDTFVNNATLLASIVTAISIGFVGYFFGMKRSHIHQQFKPSLGQESTSCSDLGFENDEEKVVRLLQTAGGRMQQRAITRECGFSKSKTSELLLDMERKGILTRKKMGRGKIVALIEKEKT